MIWPCILMIMIIRLLSGILFICGPSGANDATRARNKQYALQKSSYCPIQYFLDNLPKYFRSKEKVELGIH